MPHLRQRHIAPALRKALSASPIVGVLGHRQVGKTTLMEAFSKTYVPLDRATAAEQAGADPERFLGAFTRFPVALDECQLSPPLFPALKEHVRIHKAPGQFLLTGSVRFAGRKAIRESLTGRVLLFELLPMSVAEVCERPLAFTLTDTLAASTQRKLESLLSNLPSQLDKEIQKAFKLSLNNGGLPGVCFLRNNQLRHLKWESQLETILTRDLELVSQTNLSFQVKKRVLAELAKNQGLPLDVKKLSRRVQVSTPALKRLLMAYESLFLIRFIPCQGTENHPAYFFEDQGEAQHLADYKIDELAAFSNALFMNIRVPFLLPLTSLQNPARIFQFRTRGGAYVPFAFETGKRTLGILPSLEEKPSKAVLGSAKSFLDAFPNSNVVIVHPHKKVEILGSHLLLLPMALALI